MFDSLRPSTERIAYQTNSPLAAGITAACQKVIDIIDDLHAKGDLPNDKDLCRAAFIKDFSRDISAIVKNTTGLTVSFSVEYFYGQVNAYTAPKLAFDENKYDPDGVADILAALGRMEGSLFRYKPADSVKKQLENLSKNTSLLTGKVNPKMDKLYTAEAAIAVEFFTRKIRSSMEYTAQEIAAVIIHEIGHDVTFAENFQNFFYRATEAMDSISLLTEGGTPSKNTHVVKDVKSAVALVSDVKRKKAYLDLIENAEKIDDDGKTAATVAGYVGLDLVVGGVIGLGLSIVMSMSGLAEGIGLGIIRSITTLAEGVKSASVVKRSDTVGGIRNYSTTERIADEFASRHGMGAPLASALSKLNLETSGHRIDGEGWFMRRLSAVGAGVAQVTTLIAPCPMSVSGLTEYDHPYERLQLLVQNNMVVFKDKSLPKSVRDKWLAETEKLIKMQEAGFSRRWNGKVREFIWSTLFGLSNSRTIAGAVLNANLVDDYDRLQKLTRGLIRNQLYFRAAQLTQLSEKHGA